MVLTTRPCAARASHLTTSTDEDPFIRHQACLAVTLAATISILVSVIISNNGGSPALWASGLPVLARELRTPRPLPVRMAGRPIAQLHSKLPTTLPPPAAAADGWKSDGTQGRPPHAQPQPQPIRPLPAVHATGIVAAVLGCCTLLWSVWRRMQVWQPARVTLLSASGEVHPVPARRKQRIDPTILIQVLFCARGAGEMSC